MLKDFIIKKKKKWLIGLLSMTMTMSLGVATHILEINNDYLKAATTPPIIEGADEMIGSGSVATDKVSEHWIVQTGAPFWIEWMILFSAGAAVLMIMIGGVMFMVAGSNEEMISRAQKTITFSFIGLMLAMFSYFIVQVIENAKFTI